MIADRVIRVQGQNVNSISLLSILSNVMLKYKIIDYFA